MFDFMRNLSTQVEYRSVDEFFFTAQPKRGQSFEESALSIRDRVQERAGVPATVGSRERGHWPR